MTRLTLLAFAAVAIGCASSVDPSSLSAGGSAPKPGTANVSGTLTGLSLQSTSGIAIARSQTPFGELMIADTNLACTNIDASDHLTMDVGMQSTGTYDVVKGYPTRDKIGPRQARAHACTATGPNAAPCHDDVVGGQIVITRYDRSSGGKVEGTFRLDFTEGTVSGDFAAVRCD